MKNVTKNINNAISKFALCSNMIGIENAIIECGLITFGRYKKLDDPIYQKLNRILFRKIPQRFEKTRMYSNLKERVTI